MNRKNRFQNTEDNTPNEAYIKSVNPSENRVEFWLKNASLFFMALSGILQLIRSIVIPNGTLSFWSQIAVCIGAGCQIGDYSIESMKNNWQFILISTGIIVLAVVNIISIFSAEGGRDITEW